MGVDVARQGADQSVIGFRRGLDARSIPAVKYSASPTSYRSPAGSWSRSTATTPTPCSSTAPAIGWGVHDRLNQFGCPNLVGVDFGARADRTDASDAAARYANKRAADLKAVDYGYDVSGAILLERKDDMRRPRLASPDGGDALALTLRPSGRQARTGPRSAASRRAPETEEVDHVIPRLVVCLP